MLADGHKLPLPPSFKQAPRDKVRWVHGSLAIPKACGCDFTYSVDSFGSFHETSGDSALAVYLDVMMEGFDAGIKWMERMLSDKKAGVPDGILFWSSAMSGRELRFGTTYILKPPDMKVLGSPVRMHENMRNEGEFVASQGELFRCVINLAELREQVRGEKRVYWCSRDESQGELPNGPLPVIAKVASSSCHARLREPGISLLAQLAKRGVDWWEKRASIFFRPCTLYTSSRHLLHNQASFNSCRTSNRRNMSHFVQDRQQIRSLYAKLSKT